MTRYLFRKQNRELRRIKFRAIGAGFLIMLAVGLYMSLAAMFPSAMTTLDDMVERQNLNDLVVRVETGLEGQVLDLEAIDGVEEAEARINLASRITVQGEQNPATLLGIDPSVSPNINRLDIVEGSYFPADYNGTAMVEKGYANFQGISVGDTISVLTVSEGETGATYEEVTVVGLAYSPEFVFMPINPQSIVPVPGTLAVVYLPEPWIRTGFDIPSQVVNEFTFLLEEGKEETAKQSIVNYLAPDTVLFSITKDEVYGYALIKEDLEQAGAFNGIIAGLILIVAFFVVYSSFTRMVQKQKREIGILRALGYGRGQILVSYLYIALMVGLIASIVGIIVGIPMGIWFSDFYVEWTIHASSTQFVFPTDAMFTGLAFGPVVALIATAIAVWGTVRMEPHQAIKGVSNKVRKTKREGKASRARSNYMLTYAWRKLTRQRGRTALMVVAVAFSIVLGSMAFLMLASFNNSIAESVEESGSWDLVADYAIPLDRDDAINITSEYIDDQVLVAKIAIEWSSGERSGNGAVIGMRQDQDLYTFTMDGGERATSPDEAMVSYPIHRKQGVSVGDQITISTPIGSSTLNVVGIVDDTIGLVYVNESVIGELTMTTVFSGSYLRAEEGQVEDAKEDLMGYARVANVQDKESIKFGMDALFGNYQDLLYMIGFIAVTIAAIAISNIVYVSVLEKRTEYGQLRAIGYRKRDVSRSIYLEVIFLVIIGAVVAIPLLLGVMEGVVEYFKEFFPIYRTIFYLEDWYGYFVMIGLTFVFGLIASIPAIRFITELDVAKTVTGGRFG
jgi:putative ABC transport system permease protein